VTSGGIIEEKSYATNAFLWEKFYRYLFLRSKRNYLEGFQTLYEKNRFFEKNVTPPILLYWERTIYCFKSFELSKY
jgi:hypothetical protein